MKSAWIRALCLLFALAFVLTAALGCRKKGGQVIDEAGEQNDTEPPLEENQIAVTWHQGAVRSEKPRAAEAGTIDENAEGYYYSDVITLDSKGTCLTFATEQAVENKYYVISRWQPEEDGTWVLENPGDNYAGGTARTNTYLATEANGVTTYVYVSEKREEHVRLCYRANAEATRRTKVFLTETRDTPTLLRQKDTQFYKDLRLGQYGFTAKNYPELAGKSIYLMGDSYFNDHVYAFGANTGMPSPYNLPNLVATKYGMELRNFAKSGSSVSAYTTTNNPMCRRIDDMVDGDPDIVILEGGRNDLNIDAPLGLLRSGGQLSLDDTTFYGAVNSCIKQLKEKYPNAMIIGMTCWNVGRRSVGGVAQAEYAAAMVTACEANGVPCIDAAHFAVVNMDSAEYRAAYCRDKTDISHMNIDGMVRTAPTFEQALGSAYRAFIQSAE